MYAVAEGEMVGGSSLDVESCGVLEVTRVPIGCGERSPDDRIGW